MDDLQSAEKFVAKVVRGVFRQRMSKAEIQAVAAKVVRAVRLPATASEKQYEKSRENARVFST